MLLEPARLAEIQVSAADFFRHDHRLIFTAIEEMVAKNQPVDLVTLTAHLSQQDQLEEAGGVGYIAGIMRDTPGSSNIAAYAGIVQSRSISRKAAEVAHSLIEQVRDPAAVDAAIRSLMDLTVKERTFSASVRDTLPEVVDLIDARFRGAVKPGLKSGLKRLDSAIGGFSDGHLYVIAGRPAMGKTGFGAGVIMANPTIPSGIMSMEQPRPELVSRMIASQANLSAHALRMGKIGEGDWDKIDQAMQFLGGVPCYINDQPAPPIDVIVRQARKWKYEHNIQILLVDYIQRIKSTGDAPRHEQVEGFARSLKEIARELKIPVLALCQVNRNVESRNDKRPQMGDLRDSGAIEQEADVIITLYRDSVYYDNAEFEGIAEVSCVKNRHGPLGKITCRFNGPCIRFEDNDYESP